MMKVSVIIPHLNNFQLLNNCLQSIDAQTIGRNNFEIILVDDVSPDDSVKIVESFVSKVKENNTYSKN